MWAAIFKYFKKELSVLKKAPIAFVLISLGLSWGWIVLLDFGVSTVLNMKNHIIEVQTQGIALLKAGKPTENDASKQGTKGKPLERIEGKRFVNEKVLLDGYSIC